MKVFIYIYYFFRSVFLRGFLNTLRLILSESRWEKKLNIKTEGIKKSEQREYFHYQGASYLVLKRIFAEIYPLTSAFDFVDVGSGKGRVVFVAEYSGYNCNSGIELDKELFDIAQTNLELYQLQRKNSSILFFYVNALDFEYKNKPTVYFLFNPFSEEILTQVLNKISVCTKSETWFVYMNPLHVIAFKNDKFTLVKELKTERYLEAVVYRLNVKP